MSDMGRALMGTATADGENRAIHAAQAAISSPLLEDASIEGARGKRLTYETTRRQRTEQAPEA